MRNSGISGVKDTGMALARAPKTVNIPKAVANFNLLPSAQKAGAEDWFPNVLKALQEGNVNRAVNRAMKGDSGFTLNNLESVGIQTRLTLGGREIPGTRRAVSVLGNFAAGKRTNAFARAERAFYHDIPGQTVEKAGRAMENMHASGINQLLTRKMDQGGQIMFDSAGKPLQDAAGNVRSYPSPTAWELYDAERLFREAGVRATGDLMAEGSDAIRHTIRDSDMILLSKQYMALPKDATKAEIDKAVREAGDDIAVDLAARIQKQEIVTGEVKFEDSKIASTVDALIAYTEKQGLTVADLTPGSLLPFTNDVSIAVGDRLMAGAIVWGLKKLDATSLEALPGEATHLDYKGRPSHTIRQLIGPNGSVSDRSSTLREFYNHTAIIETTDAAMQTGRGQLSENLFRATANPHAALASMGFDGTVDHLNLAGRNIAPEDLLENLKETQELIRGTKTPAGTAMPLAFIQVLARAGDFAPVLKGDMAAGTHLIRANNLVRITKLGLDQLEALEVFTTELGVGGGKAFLNANKKFNQQGVKDADELMSGGAGGWKALPKSPGENKRWKPATVEAKRLEIFVRTQVTARIRNGWFNPEHGSKPNAFAMFSNSDRAFLTQVNATYPEMISEELGILRGWLNEWTESADRFKLYDRNMSPEEAELAKNVDLWAAEATLTVRLFGGEAVDALNATVTDGVMKALTREEADLTAGLIMAGRRKRTGVGDFFGELRQTSKGLTAYRGIKDGSYRAEAVFNSKNTETVLAGVLLEASDFLNGLGKLRVGELQGAVDYMVRQRRMFSGGASATPGFSGRNAKGGLIMNWLRGVRPETYNQYVEHSGVARRAKAEENTFALGLGANGSSPIWEEITDETQRKVVQSIAYSGRTTAGSASGDMMDFQFELDEAALRLRMGKTETSRAGRAQASVTRTLDRIGARSEQLIQPPIRRIATGGRTSGDGYSRERFSRNSQGGGLPSAHRETTEELLRGALMYSDMMTQGMSFDAAMADVAVTHFDYWDFTQAGRMADTMMPFYLFRARIAATTLNMIFSTPGMGSQLARLQKANEEDDPYGTGFDDKPYTLGNGILGGYTFVGTVDDPRVAGLETVRSVSRLLDGDVDEVLKDEFGSKLLPVADYFLARTTDTKSGFGEARQDGSREADQTRYQDGLIPRLAEGVAWTDAKVSLVIEALTGKEIHPIMWLLKLTGNFQIVDGELWSTGMAEEWASDMIPLLGVAETLLNSVPSLRAEYNPNGPFKTREDWERSQTAKAVNALLGGGGVPVELVPEYYQELWVNNTERNIRDEAKKLVAGQITQESFADNVLQGWKDTMTQVEQEFLDDLLEGMVD